MRISIIIFLVFISNLTFGQEVYYADRDEYKSNKFVYEFYLFKDSTCYLRGHYFDNSAYYIYKGVLRKTNGTLYEFKYQPVVNFTCNKGLHVNDSLRFYLTQTDTIISSLTYKIKPEKEAWTKVDLKLGRTEVYVKGANKQFFQVDTKFIDPLTNKIILFSVGVNSDPDFTYYGTKTDFNTIQVSVVKDKLTIYPDNKHIHDKDTFVLRK